MSEDQILEDDTKDRIAKFAESKADDRHGYGGIEDFDADEDAEPTESEIQDFRRKFEEGFDDDRELEFAVEMFKAMYRLRVHDLA